MKRKNKGFTLIELLAVIVILGLLMAIAIPSVTKYITQSRKKTVSTTIDNYMSALTNQVNDMEYTFTGTNTIYAVPIECIAVERGGTNPFGYWLHANNSYWAYVLVQYDDNTSSYTYGFTFKDSAGYGLYPTTSEKLNENGSQIQTGLNLTQPTNGNITNITEKANWTGFDVEDNTNLVVLEAAGEGETGNGTTTCTLCQKGDNYAEVEATKPKTLASGICGATQEACAWKLTDDYTLKIYGNGAMNNFTSSTIPWATYSGQIKKVVIENGVTTIGNYAFNSCSSLTTMSIGGSVTTIGNYAFYGCSSLKTMSIGGSVTTIGSSAFYGCSSLTTIYYYGTNSPSCSFPKGVSPTIIVSESYGSNSFCGKAATRQ